MGRTFLLCLVLLPGCAAVGAPGAPLLAIPAAVEGLSLRAFGRTTGDALVSLATGEDCSIARIGRGEAYCGRDDAPAPPPVCTRSLGGVDCWTVPPAAWPPYRGVADGPATLNEAQESNRIGWTGRIARAMPSPMAPDATPAAQPVAVITPASPPPAAPAPEPAAAPPQDPPPSERPAARRSTRPAARTRPPAPAGAAPAASAPAEAAPAPSAPVAVIEPAPTAAEAARRALEPSSPPPGGGAAVAARRALDPAPSADQR